MINFRKIKGVGIVGYGAYVPRMRITVREIAAAHNLNGGQIEKSLLVREKAVADWDEDAVTMAYTAGAKAVKQSGVDPKKIGAIYVGSESHPYAVKSTGTIVAEALGMENEYYTCDLEFACKAGMSAVQIVVAQLLAEFISYGLAIGSDKAQAKAGDILEYSAGAGAGALVLGKRRVLAEITGIYSVNSDTLDFWRRSEEKYPSHWGRFTGEPGYFRHVVEATENFLDYSQSRIADYAHVVLHMPNGKFPQKAAEKLGVREKQMARGMVVAEIGNPYSASTLIGLCEVLDQAKAGEKILVTAYGSGAGADVIALKTTPWLVKSRLEKKGKHRKNINLSYGQYRVLQD